MAKTIELRRHTDDDGDVLSAEGVRGAVSIGRSLAGDYQLVVSSGAQRATQAAACFLAGLGQAVPAGVVVEPRLRSEHEDRWRAIAGEADGSDLESFRAVDPDFVSAEAEALGEGLRQVFDQLDEGGRALAVGHSPTNEAAVLGVTGEFVAPLGKGEGVLVIADGGDFRVEPLDS